MLSSLAGGNTPAILLCKKMEKVYLNLIHLKESLFVTLFKFLRGNVPVYHSKIQGPFINLDLHSGGLCLEFDLFRTGKRLVNLIPHSEMLCSVMRCTLAEAALDESAHHGFGVLAYHDEFVDKVATFLHTFFVVFHWRLL